MTAEIQKRRRGEEEEKRKEEEDEDEDEVAGYLLQHETAKRR